MAKAKKSAKASKPPKTVQKKTSKTKLNKSEGEHPHTNQPRTGDMSQVPPSNPTSDAPAAGTADVHPMAEGGPPEATGGDAAK